MNTDPNYPEAYQKGYIYFCERQFVVNNKVLIPRVETEQLVDNVSSYIKNKNLDSSQISIYDIGTGSGCIAITLALQYPHAKITAIDISDDALKIAKANAAKHNVTNQIAFMQNDLLENIFSNIDILVSNLPYIPTSRVKTLDPSVRDFEPVLALDGGNDGFELYRQLLRQIANLHRIPSYMIFEIDEEQEKLAVSEAKSIFTNRTIEIKKDKYGYNRFLEIS